MYRQKADAVGASMTAAAGNLVLCRVQRFMRMLLSAVCRLSQVNTTSTSILSYLCRLFVRALMRCTKALMTGLLILALANKKDRQQPPHQVWRKPKSL